MRLAFHISIATGVPVKSVVTFRAARRMSIGRTPIGGGAPPRPASPLARSSGGAHAAKIDSDTAASLRIGPALCNDDAAPQLRETSTRRAAPEARIGTAR